MERRWIVGDALLYGASALFAALTAAFASIPLYREWGRMAVAPYAVGAAAALFIAARGGSVRARALLAILVLAGAALLPLGFEVTWRARSSPGLHAQSEAIVTEEAADALVDGRNPYAVSYLEGPLASRPLGTKTHFPYLPGMLAFGLPRAADDHHAWVDARIAFTVVALGIAAVALRNRRLPPASGLRAFQFLAVLPTGALLLATGGDDLPVLALLLLAVLLAADHRVVASGLVLGLALATKQTAWILLPFLGAAMFVAQGRTAAARLGGAAAAMALPVTGIFVAWNPGAFWEDAVRFPLGLGKAASAATTPTLGSALIDAFPGLRIPLTALFITLVVGFAVALLVRWPPSDAGGAATRAALVAAVAILLAPAARAGYVVYPIDLAVWGWLVTGSMRAPADSRPPAWSGEPAS